MPGSPGTVEAGSRGTAVVAGATGYLGGHVVRALHDDGWRVRALARDAARLGELRTSCDEVFVGEATRADTLGDLCKGADVVFSSLGIRHFRRRPTIWDVDLGANLNVLARAREAGVRHFVFVSVLGAEQLRPRLAVAEARERVVDALRESSLAWTVMRPTGFFNDMKEFFDMARRGRVWLLGDGQNRLNPIHGADLADEVARCLREPASGGDQRAVGGPDTFTQQQIAELAFQVLGRHPRMSHVPFGVLRATSTLLRPFNQNASTFLGMLAAIEHVEAVAPAIGTHHLADYFRELAATA